MPATTFKKATLSSCAVVGWLALAYMAVDRRLLPLWILAVVLAGTVAGVLSISGRFPLQATGRATPRDIALIRVVICGVLLANLVWERIATAALLRRELESAMGFYTLVVNLVPGLRDVVRSEFGLGCLQLFAIIAMILAIIGKRPRLVLPMAFLSYLLVGGVPRAFSHCYHTCLVPLHALAILSIAAFAPHPKTRHAAVTNATWTRYSIWTAISISYFSAGVAKLYRGGWSWWNSDNLRRIAYSDGLAPMEFDFDLGLVWRSAPDGVFAGMGLFGLAVELAYPLVIVSPVARRVLPYSAVLMHLGIALVQNVLFFDMLFMPLVFLSAPTAKDSRSAAAEPSPGPRYPKGLVVTTTMFLAALVATSCWGTYYYPFVSWGMYSENHTGYDGIKYFRLLQTTRQGRTGEFHLDKGLPVLKDTRYRDHLSKLNSGAESRMLFGELIRQSVLRQNESRESDSAIETVTVEQRRWNLQDDPWNIESSDLLGAWEFRISGSTCTVRAVYPAD